MSTSAAEMMPNVFPYLSAVSLLVANASRDTGRQGIPHEVAFPC